MTGAATRGGRTVLLADGGRVFLRPLQAGDRAELAHGYESLSPLSRHLRFFGAPDHLSEQQLDELLDLDGVDRVAIGAWADDGAGRRRGVGVARYGRRRTDPLTAEAAVTVLDEERGRGIGTVLLLALVDEARAHGIEVLTASVLWENEDLLRALRVRGAEIVPSEPGIAAVRMRLADLRPDPVAGAPSDCADGGDSRSAGPGADQRVVRRPLRRGA